ncbi:MAG: ABC transporter substrate-binding protein [Nitrososphaerota archaeon]
MGNKKKAITTTMAIALVVALVVGLVLGYLVSMLTAPPAAATITETVASTKTLATTVFQTTTVGAPGVSTVTVFQTSTVTAPTGLPKEILIGGLLPLTGPLASFGENDKAAVEIAVEEINAFLKDLGIPSTVKFIVEDSEVKPAVALEKLTSLNAKGVKFIIGPMASSEVKHIKGYADANKILILSQSSTAPELAVEDDFIFRLCPTDLAQGPAIARAIYDSGVRSIVAVWRGDPWGDGLYKAAADKFKQLGGEVAAEIRYDPEAKEFSAEVSTLASKVNELVNKYGADKVGVLDIAFEEAAILLKQASEYDILGKVKWFGSDGTALSEDIRKDPTSAGFSVKTKFLNTIFAPTKSKRYLDLRDKVMSKVGREPETYAYNSYDAAWLIALSILCVGKYDAEAVKKVLPTIARGFFGASGLTTLDKAGDRAPTDYELWAIVEEAGAYKWKHVATYNFATDSITWH